MSGRQRSMAIRTGINKQGWQTSDFPVACQKCYGENPYMRMLKENYGQQCRICFRPFTVFKWKGDRGIYKRTCVCSGCSKQKNICQVCTLDLQFGLPMEVRDRRCGKNGRHLIDQNFSNADSMKIKPPPPPGPPPPLKTHPSDKELVYIPEKESDQQQDNANKKESNNVEEKQENKIGEKQGQSPHKQQQLKINQKQAPKAEEQKYNPDQDE